MRSGAFTPIASSLHVDGFTGQPATHVSGVVFHDPPASTTSSSWAVGSGAAGMVAALTAAHEGLSTVVIEKAPHYGGSTARSGGGVWIPNNDILGRDGVTDTAEAARTYLHGIIGDVVEPERIDARKLGPEMSGLEPPYGKVPLNVVVMQQDYVRLNMLKRHPRGVLRSLKVGARARIWEEDDRLAAASPRRSETTNRCSRACSWCRLSCAECESTENSLAAVISLSVAFGSFVAMVDAQFLGADPRGTDLAALVAA